MKAIGFGEILVCQTAKKSNLPLVKGYVYGRRINTNLLQI